MTKSNRQIEDNSRKESSTISEQSIVLSLNSLSFSNENCSNKLCGCKRSLKRNDRSNTSLCDIFGAKESKRICNESEVNRDSISKDIKIRHTKQKSIKKKSFKTADFKVFGNLEDFVNFRSLVISSDECKLLNSYSGQTFKELRGDFTNNISSIIKDTKAINLSTDDGLCKPCSSIMHGCSHQALTQHNDDWTTDELSSYFEYFCHIPKNMSDMAKMMYT